MILKVISAGRGEGKTSFLLKYIRRMIMDQRSVGGIASPALFEAEHRVGYDLLDVHSGTRRLLAQVDESGNGNPRTGRYRFEPEAIEAGNTSILSAVRDGFDVITIDEVGPLELQGEGWAPALEFALQECRPEQELIVVVRRSLLSDLLTRFPSPAWSGARRVSPPWPWLLDT
jgi:nucleoside-triphosphatase THEP1